MKLKRRIIKKARIEIIPMIDTMFFLLVFFMVATLSMTVQQGLSVNLPHAVTARDEVRRTVTLTLTKDRTIAGPKYVEHLVDGVLYMEGDRFGAYRLLRAGKNRYGRSGETGFFEMTSNGLVPIADPSSAFVSDVHNLQPGSVVVAAAQGSFAVLVEVQALAATSYLPSPRRIATGLDYGRLMIALAILERRAGTSAGGKDIYVNISGDFSVEDRGIDLALGWSLYSAVRNTPVRDAVMPVAEVGLAGDLRPVLNLHRRIELGARMGFREFVISDKARDDLSDLSGITLHRKRYVAEAIAIGFPRATAGTAPDEH